MTIANFLKKMYFYNFDTLSVNMIYSVIMFI